MVHNARPLLTLCLLVGPIVALSLASACDDGDDSGDTDAAALAADASEQSNVDAGEASLSIPDPGSGEASWGSVSDHGTLDTAHPVGVVTTSPGYLEGILDPTTFDGFYVFRAGDALSTFGVNLVGGAAEIEYVHLHEGEGLLFGEELVPTENLTPNAATWPVQPGAIYVLEIHSVAGGFF